MQWLLTVLSLVLAVSATAQVQGQLPEVDQEMETEESNILDELDPNDPKSYELLRQFDKAFEYDKGLRSFGRGIAELLQNIAGCGRASCGVFAHVHKGRNEQYMELYVGGVRQTEWAVSTGAPGFTTPRFDQYLEGPVADKYTSRTYPGGDYIDDQGRRLGNMPYAVFIHRGWAIHGTGRGNWAKLGKVASHGCIRLHPTNGKIFNRLVLQYGLKNTWVLID